MPSSLTRYVDPYIDHTRYYAFPPISASTLPDIPRIGPSTASAIDPAAPELDAAGEISPLDELHIHLNDTKSQANFEQICESNYQAQPVYDPSLTTDSYYEHSSYLPSQETISPYLLNHPGDVYYEPPSSNLHNMELLDIDFDNSALETLPALTYTLASPQMGNMSTTTNAIDASPLFSIPDTTLALDGIGTCYGESSIVGDMFPPYLTGLDSVNLPPVYGDTGLQGLQTQTFGFSSPMCSLGADNMSFDYVPDFVGGPSHIQHEPTLAPPLDDVYDFVLGASDHHNENPADWGIHPSESPTQDLPHTRSKGRNAQRDTSKDELLIRLKAQGISYKQIKEMGGFDEAESTLRGRYRALTKPREARLRKPEWGDREVSAIFAVGNRRC